MLCVCLRQCANVVSCGQGNTLFVECSMILSGQFRPHSTPPLCFRLFFSPLSSLRFPCFALTLERYSFVPHIACLLSSRCANRGTCGRLGRAGVRAAMPVTGE